MSNDNTPSSWIKPARLCEIVSLMLGIHSIKLREWHCEPIHGGVELTNAIFRCHGLADSGDKVLHWSLIAKMTSKDTHNDHPDGYRYWRREALAYQSGFLQNMPKYLSAPKLYAVDEDQDKTILIWMEDLTDDFQRIWTLEVYEKMAFQLGLFNGSYLTKRDLPDEDWMTHDWLRKYVENAAPAITYITKNPEHPLVKSLYGKEWPILLAFWQIRYDLFRSLDKMPLVFCHQDSIRANLFIQTGQPTAIDWGYAGIAPLGTDLVPLIAYLEGLNDIPQEKVYEMNRVCFSAYLQGIKISNPQISARSLRRSVIFIQLLRYILGGSVGELFPYLQDEKTQETVAKAFDKTVEEVSKTEDFVAQYCLSKVIEATKLMGITTLIKFIYYILIFSIRRYWHTDLAVQETL
jgi:hypothetical protein